MFVNCDKSSSSSSIITKSESEKCMKSSVNWSSTFYPAIVSAHSNISAAPFGKTGFAASSTGQITIEFYTEIVFVSSEIYGGGGTAIFYLQNSIVKTLAGPIFNEKIKCDKIIFNFPVLSALAPVIYEDCYAVEAESFDYQTGETNFKFLTENGTFNGSSVVPTSAGLIKFYFPLGTVIYRADFTGKIFLFNKNNQIIYEDTKLFFSQEVFAVGFDTSVNFLVFQKKTELNSYIVETFDYPRGYANTRNKNFKSTGAVMDTNIAGPFGSPNVAFGGPGIGAGGSNNAVYLGKALYGGNSEFPVPTGSFAVNFTKKMQINYLKFIGSGSFNFGINITVPDFGLNHYYFYSTPFWAESITFSGQLVLTEISYSGEIIGEIIPETINIDFNNFIEGETNIENKYFFISTINQINNPPIILNSTITPYTDFATPNITSGGTGIGSGGETGKPGENSISRGKVLVYSDDTAKDVLPGTGIININFKKEIYLYSLTFLNCVGSFLDFTISDYGVNSVQEIFIKKYLSSISLNVSGAIVSMKITDFYSESLSGSFIADLSTPVPEFSFTAFDTNIANQYGTPNVAFGGPGIGSGGSAGPGNNQVYRGNATFSTLTFSASTFVFYIDVIDSELGNNLIIDGKTFYTGNFGANSVYRLNYNNYAATIIPNGLAILEISYFAKKREIVKLNGPTPVSLNTNLTGNYSFQVAGLNNTAFSNIFAVKAISTNVGAILTQASKGSAGEEVDAVWPAGSPVQIYFRILPGVGDFYFVIS